MNREVGCYIIKPRSKRAFKKFHYLRVFNENKNKYVQIDDGTPQEANKDLQILSGMTATVEIRTGKNTILNYLLKPIAKTLVESMGER